MSKDTNESNLFERLKDWLQQREGSYHWTNDWCGDTESGFHSEDVFDMDGLLKEIDAFSAELKKENRK